MINKMQHLRRQDAPSAKLASASYAKPQILAQAKASIARFSASCNAANHCRDCKDAGS